MKKFLVAACCLSLLAGVTAASAQTTAPQSEQGMKASEPMNANAKMKKKKKTMKKTSMKKDDAMPAAGAAK